MASDEFHRRFIGGLKVILPLVALGLLATLFLLSRKVDPTANMPITQVDLEQRAQDQGASNPSFSGVASGGEQIIFRADMVRPDPDAPERLLAEEVAAKLTLNGGTIVNVTSRHGEAGGDLSGAELYGDVQVTTTTGYDIRTDRLVADFETLRAQSPGRVSGRGPFGTIEAGRMTLVTEDQPGAAHLLFTDGVKLLYKPRGNKE